MRGVGRRALGCVTAVASCAVILVGASAAQAQRPEKVGDGIKTGQMSVQMFNYGTYISNGGNTGPANPVAGVPAECATATSTLCRWTRLERLFAFLQSKGVTSVELFGHAAFPSNTDIDGEFGLRAYRALLDEYGLHAAGWHGSMSEAGWEERVNAAKILGADYLGSGGVGSPGIGTYANTLATAQTLNRLGKRSVEAGVGPAYIHNHTGEFDTKYVDNGVLKTAFDILMERTDPRYVVAEVDVFWSSDAFNDITGEASAALINKWESRVKMLHIKDGVSIVGQPSPTNSRSGSPRATGTGELDFRPIFAAANNRVQYYHQEHDPDTNAVPPQGTLTDADISLTNLKGTGPASVPALLAIPPSFPSVPAGTPAASNVVPVVVQNTGDQPLTITNIQVQADLLDQPSQNDFAVVSDNCRAAPLAPGQPNATPPIPRGTCIVNVGFKPTRTNTTSVARLQFTANADNATERVLLTGKSTGESLVGVSADVPSLLQLSVPTGGGSLGSLVPGVSRDYTTALAATVTTTTGDAALTVTDPSSTPGKLANGSLTLAQPLNMRVVGEGEIPPFAPLAQNNDPQLLKSWSSPVSALPLTFEFRQSVAATEPLRAGQYNKTLTFTLSTTTP